MRSTPDMAALNRAHLRTTSPEDEMSFRSNEEIIYEGSDAEDSPLTKEERQKRRDAIGLRYLQGHVPFIMSAQLRGPFNSESKWMNPWRSKRPIQRQLTKRPAVLEHHSLDNNTAAVGFGKRTRNGSNSSGSIGIRAEALTECFSASVDIVGNRQPELPDLYSEFKRFAPVERRRRNDTEDPDERENVPQLAKTGAKRRADTRWLKGADVGKRPRNDWADPTSPTPKDRSRDITVNDKIVVDTRGVSREKLKKQKGRPYAEAAVLLPMESISVEKPNVEATSHPTVKRIKRRGKGILTNPESAPRNSSIDRKEASKVGRPHIASPSNTISDNEDETDKTIEICRTAPRYSTYGSSFIAPSSSFTCNPLQPRVSAQTFEPSPIRTFTRDQLDQKILYGLSQASRLAFAAQRLTPLKLDDSTLNIMERRSPHLNKEKIASSSSAKKLPQQTLPILSNHASDAASDSQPSLENLVAAEKNKTKRSSRSFNEDSPLPPGSFMYRRVRHKIRLPADDEQHAGPRYAINERNKSQKADSSLLMEKQGDTPSKVILSRCHQSQIDLVNPQFPMFDSVQKPPDSMSTIQVTENDDAESVTSQPVARKFDKRAPIRTSSAPISPTITDVEVNELGKDDETCREVASDGCNNGESLNEQVVPIQEKGECEVQHGQPTFDTESPSREATPQEPDNRDIEHREAKRYCKIPNIVINEEPDLDDMTLSQDPNSQHVNVEPAAHKPTPEHDCHTDAIKNPLSKSSSPPPSVTGEDQISDTGFISAIKNANFQQPTPQSPWATEEVVLASQSILVKSASVNRQFSMSQSKDAAVLFLDADLNCSADSSSLNGVSPESDKIHLSRPTSPGFSPATPTLNTNTPSQTRLSPPKSLISRLARAGIPAFVSLANPWASNTQSPAKSPLLTRTKKRVSFTHFPLDRDAETTTEQLHDHSSQQERKRHGPNKLSSPPPLSGVEELAERKDKFHQQLKGTRGIVTALASKNEVKSESGGGSNIPSSPGVAGMAEAFLAADARMSLSNVKAGNVVDCSSNVDNLSEVEGWQKEGEAVTGLSLPVMPESQTVNPWGDKDEAPPFLLADCEHGEEEEDELVENVLSDMDAMLGDWNVDTELERVRKKGNVETEKKTTARERLIDERD